MSTSPVTSALPACPACAARGIATELRDGAALDGHGCPRCGGVLLPATGSERLLHDELALDRAVLLEIAQSFGGRRYGCPACRSKMRALLVRGVDIDLCFHCAALWLDDGELERLSGGRYRSTIRSLATTTTTALVGQPDAVVRIDARHPVRRGSRDLLGMAAFFAAMAWWGQRFGDVPMYACIALLVMMVLNMRPTVVDIFPRARRLLRSHQWLPGDPRDPRAEQLDDHRFVVVRPWAHLAEIALVDSAGRTIVVIAVEQRHGAINTASEQARRLGATLVVHPALATDEQTATTTTTLPWVPTRESTITFRRRAGGPSWQLAGTVDGRPSWLLSSAVPARGDEDAKQRLALYFHLDVDGVTVARLHDDGHGNTVVVGADGEPLASIRRRQRAGAQWHTITRAHTAHRLHLIDLPLTSETWIVDDGATRHASIKHIDTAIMLFTRQNGSDDALLVVLLFAQAAIFSDLGKR